ncbi:MAG: T9SS type A sorting domain-containing protein [Lentimicrobium sp.]|nr:T9SS type A sorting domain-containing protein [Lentimicrobium sp.]
MRKITFLFVLMFTFAGFSMAQVVENFESLKMNAFDAGANGAVTVVANPDQAGINPSYYVGKMVRGFDGQPWAGWYATLGTPVDVTANKYVHIKIWKPRISPVVFKYERSDLNSGDVYSMNPQTLAGEWEELVFDMSVVSGDYVKIVLIPDFEDPLTLTEDIEIYFDDLYVNNDSTPGSSPVQIMEDFEHIPLNIMTGGDEDLSKFTLVPNPDPSGLNLSDHVIKFDRDKDGVPWGGFYSGTPVDFTTNKYMHVKVWKPRISPIKFKIEGGEGGNFEWPSTLPQTEVNSWQDYVFDFSANTGIFPTIVFMPDFEDPLTLTEDIEIYFDDFILSDDPNPFLPPQLVLNVDMTEAGDMTDIPVYLAGALGGVYGTWNEPGTNENNLMTDDDGDGIYTTTIFLPDGLYAFKFFKGTGWGAGDPAPGGDRVLQYAGNMNVSYKWGVDGALSVPENPLADKVQMYPNPVSNELIINTSVSIKEVTITSMLGQKVGTYQLNNNGRTSINTNGLSSGLYFVTFYGKDGSRLVQKLIKN